LLYVVAWVRQTGFDDSYMFTRYARNIAEGYGYVFNRGGDHVDGLTSPLWLAVFLLGWPFASEDWLWTGRYQVLLSFASALVLVVVLYRALQAVLPRRFAPAAIAAPVWLMHGPFQLPQHIVNGMETLLAGALLVIWSW